MQGALWGGLTAGLTFGVASMFPKDGIGRTIAHGVSKGVTSVLQGGKFRDGFVGGFLGHAAGGLGQRLGFGAPGDGSIGGFIGRTVTAAVVAGTISELTGGKFANAAVSAAFTHMFNREVHIQEKFNDLLAKIRGNAYGGPILKSIMEHPRLGALKIRDAYMWEKIGGRIANRALFKTFFLNDNYSKGGLVDAEIAIDLSVSQVTVYSVLGKAIPTGPDTVLFHELAHVYIVLNNEPDSEVWASSHEGSYGNYNRDYDRMPEVKW